MRRLLRWVVILIVVGGMGTGGVVGAVVWWRQGTVRNYNTATLSLGRVETVVNSTGTVKPVQTVSIGAFTSGPIKDVYVDFNDQVEVGTRLAKIDPQLSKAAYDRDRAALRIQLADQNRIEALLEQAQNNERRSRQLEAVNKDYISATEIDQFKFNTLTIKAQLELAKASVEQARANLENSKANLEYCDIISPVKGLVIERKIDKGQTVAAAFQTPELFIVAPDMSSMYVFASVDEADIGLIRKAEANQRLVKFTVDAYPTDLFEGHIHQVRNNSSTTQNVVTYPVVIKAPNPGLKLMPGMTANISFEIDAKSEVLRVPTAALRYVPTVEEVAPDDRHYVDMKSDKSTEDESKKRSAAEKAEQAKKRQRRLVWVQDGKYLRAVPVLLGLIENQYAEVLEGDLKDGDVVVTGLKALPAAR